MVRHFGRSLRADRVHSPVDQAGAQAGRWTAPANDEAETAGDAIAEPARQRAAAAE